MKSIKTLIISGAVTLAMALPLSGMAMDHSPQGKLNKGDQVAAQACIIQLVKSDKSSSVIQNAYCDGSDKSCSDMVKKLIKQAGKLSLSREMTVAVKANSASMACSGVAVACKKNSCMSSGASGS